MRETNQKNNLPKVIYIMGTARSGSTILEILLANGRYAFGAGELTHLIEDGFVNDKLCSCQHYTSKCEIWSEVKKKIGLNSREFQNWVHLEKHIDWHDGFLRQLFGRVSQKDSQAYKELNQRLLAVIQQITASNVVLDSSKYAGRAMALQQIAEINISIICLTRSPRGIMGSFQKPNKDEQQTKSPLETLVYYLVTLASLRMACWLLGKRVFQLRYEDLLSNPKGTLESIETWCGMDLTESKNRLIEQKAFDVGHLVTSNRLRKHGKVKFNSINNSEAVSSLSTKMIVTIMEFWRWILRY